MFLRLLWFPSTGGGGCNQRVGLTFSAWASSDFRLLVTVFNSSSSSAHLLRGVQTRGERVPRRIGIRVGIEVKRKVRMDRNIGNK